MSTVSTLFLNLLSHLRRDDEGADMAEYALVLVLIAVVAFIAVQGVGSEVTCAFNKIVAGLQNTTPAC